MSLFVTVGSTSFDNLIQTVCSENCLDFLVSNGFKEITFQIGKGRVIPKENPSVKIGFYRFKESITENVKNASLIISQGSAEAILEILSEDKPLIVVLNEESMDNQGELLEKLASEDFLKYTSCSSLIQTLQECLSPDFSRKSYVSQDKFGGIFCNLLGLE